MTTGEKALVTGGSAGIGKAITRKLAGQGMEVAIFGTNLQRGVQAVEEINEAVGAERCLFYQVDVRDTAQVDSGIQEVLRAFGAVDVVVNNAGVTRDQLLMRMSEQEWDDVMDINVKSCYNVVHALARPMMKAKKGCIICITSVVGLTGNAGQTNYAASKAAMVGFTKALAKELAPRGVRANCIAPGFIETDMTAVLSEQQRQTILEQIPLGKMGKPDDIADAVLFLAGPMGQYITGQVITVDGGMVM